MKDMDYIEMRTPVEASGTKISLYALQPALLAGHCNFSTRSCPSQQNHSLVECWHKLSLHDKKQSQDV